MYIIHKNIDDDLETLPDITETPIWKEYDDMQCSKNVKLLANLYMAIQKRENYYQLNTPTAYGDPQYMYHCGMVIGILQASDMEEIAENNCIIIKKNNRRVLIIEKVKRAKAYYECKKEISELMKSLGI